MTPLPLEQWRDFYVLIGTAAGVIVGANFVVVTLAGNMPNRQIGVRGFITPTAVHLASVLVGSAILAAPTLNGTFLALLLGGGGVAGVIYAIVVITRIWKLKLAPEDRIFYCVLPLLVYVALAAASLLAARDGETCLEVIAAAFVALLLVGMRNAWDMASFTMMRDPNDPPPEI
ncbi:MAG TPA: hypothetical protein VHW02_04015 [Rhizomicrobium sp.]|jgi:hypothetical protein|nr:hypothetical protein [Rhizomicrobium sp.]